MSQAPSLLLYSPIVIQYILNNYINITQSLQVTLGFVIWWVWANIFITYFSKLYLKTRILQKLSRDDRKKKKETTDAFWRQNLCPSPSCAHTKQKKKKKKALKSGRSWCEFKPCSVLLAVWPLSQGDSSLSTGHI